MPKMRRGELAFYKMMNEAELSKYVNDFPENTEYVRSFLEKHQYNWIKKEWKKRKQ